ncbi:MAG TPA: ABC transporter substrate-binding protein [Candidatus Limnocylindrales bacterium]|nr:ABC transporter substrate-binding protein [Candidatus Limnocylindrales bacterium]
MSRTTRWSPLAAIGTVAIVFAACGGSASPSPSSAAPASTTPSTAAASQAVSEAPFTGSVYPTTGEAPCGVAPYTGEFKKITAVDRHTVEFQLCTPDVAFLSKVAFSAFGIQDSDYLDKHAADKSYLTQPNGTGPYKLKSWEKGNRIVFEANPNYWGTKALTPSLEFRWSDQAAQRWLELQSGSVDGIDNPGTDDIAAIQANADVKFYKREGLNTLFIGMNDTKAPWTDENVRKAIALGINRKELVDNFYPEGSEVATHFTPCSIPFGCEGDATWDFDAAQGKQLLQAANFDFGKTYKLSFRAAVRGYLPDPPQIATAIKAQLKTNLGINVDLDLQESGAFLDANAAGTLPGLWLLGWGADYPDPTNFLDYHFGSGSGKKFGKPFDDIAAALNKGAQSADDATRKAAYTEANNLIKQHVPAVIVAHGGSGTVFKADVTGAHSSPLSNEIFSVMKAADRANLVWMQNAEPLSLYCGDETDGETLRACEAVTESLYAYKVGGTDVEPSLATECKPNTDLTTWTCTLRDGVTFHDGATFDANDVVASFAAQWDTKNKNHVGRSGAFEYLPGLFGGFLNPPPAA